MWDIDFNRLRYRVFVYDPQAPMIFSSGIFICWYPVTVSDFFIARFMAGTVG